MRVRAAQEGGGQVGAGRGLGARVSRCAPKPRDTVGCAFCWLEARGRPCAALRSAREGAFVSGGRTEGRSYYRFLITDLSRLRVQGGSSMTPSTSPYVRPNVRSRTTYDWTWPPRTQQNSDAHFKGLRFLPFTFVICFCTLRPRCNRL